MHPRPSPIAASLYTLRDLNADVIIMHGPHGCCFRTGRLLESDGVRVVTTAMAENEKKLADCNTDGVEEMVHVMPMTNVLREDERKQPFTREILLEGAPERNEDSWQVPRLVK